MWSRLSLINLSRMNFSQVFYTNLYKVFKVYYMSFPLMPYSLMKMMILSLIFVSLLIRYTMILSIIYIMPRPQPIFYRQRSIYIQLYRLKPMSCIYQLLNQNIFYSFQNLFQQSLAYTRNEDISLVLRIILQTMLRQFQSITFCQSTSFPFSPFLRIIGKIYFRHPVTISYQTTSAYASAGSEVKELEIALSAEMENCFLAVTNCIIIELPFI